MEKLSRVYLVIATISLTFKGKFKLTKSVKIKKASYRHSLVLSLLSPTS